MDEFYAAWGRGRPASSRRMLKRPVHELYKPFMLSELGNQKMYSVRRKPETPACAENMAVPILRRKV